MCGAPMGHLADLCEVGIWPAKRILLCRRCASIIAKSN
jgi:hypothetical protein